MRWIKVNISYRDGKHLDQWDAETLGDTSMILVIEDGRIADIADLPRIVQSAAIELVSRTEGLVPAKTEPVPA